MTPKPRHLIDLVDVDSAKWEDYARHTIGPLRWVYRAEAKRLRSIEAGRFNHFDGITVVSDHEASLYRQRAGSHPGLTVVRQDVDTAYFRPLPDVDAKTILSSGGLITGRTWKGSPGLCAT